MSEEKPNLETPRDFLISMGLSIPDNLPETWDALRAEAGKFGNLDYVKHNSFGSGLQFPSVGMSPNAIQEACGLDIDEEMDSKL